MKRVKTCLRTPGGKFYGFKKLEKYFDIDFDEYREPFTESGLMAQDVWYDAPELRHLVHLGADANPVDTKPVAPVDGDIQQDPDYSSWGT